MYLSKSKYTKALQCPKILWMDKYMPEKAEQDDSVDSVFETGNEVGDLARQYFGEYALVDFDKGLSSMIEETKDYIKAGATNIAEASFSYNGNFCSVDILHKNAYGWDIVEVKCSTWVHSVYLDDMAFQFYVLKKCGINVTGVYNMHLNSDYIRQGDLDLQQLFKIENCTEIVLEKQRMIESNINGIGRYMARSDDFEPERDLGIYCYEPYPCVYYRYCSRHLPELSVFNIRNFSKKKKFDLYYKGIVSFDDIIKKKPKLSSKQWLQVGTAVNHYAPHIDKPGIKSCIEQYTYPLYYLDFETYQPAIPEFDGERPYMQVPFQYSLHIQKEKGCELKHREHLGVAGTDTRRALAEQLCRDIPKDVCSLAYNMKFEKMVIKQLAEQYPDLAEHLMNIHDNMQDLMFPFKERYYYSEALEGSYSIKYVLPALCPDDPELDYHNLDGIHNGGEAMAAFPDLPNHIPEEQEVIRKNLLAYCELDTLAMVKILEKLYKICD